LAGVGASNLDHRHRGSGIARESSEIQHHQGDDDNDQDEACSDQRDSQST
jgi:hypothetical protein